MNQEKIVTYHLTDLSKGLILGILLIALSGIYSPHRLFPFFIGIAGSYILIQASAFSHLLLFVVIEALVSDYGWARFIPEISKKFLGVMKEFFIERREMKKKEEKGAITPPEQRKPHTHQVITRTDNYPW